MTLSAQETEQTRRFDEFYLRSQSPVMMSIERSVCGCDYGGNSWTNRAQAEQMLKHLDLTAGVRLLDLGAGSGWPGLYLSRLSGCETVLADLPLSGLRMARQRAAREGTAGKINTVLADGAELPFEEASFDAISHSDLLCCLEQKKSVLAACRQVVKTSGRMAFTVISIAPGLTGERYQRALDNGPEFIASKTGYRELLVQTGWVECHYEDLTPAYAEACGALITADEQHRQELVSLLGEQAFEERVNGWRFKLEALNDGLLRREFYVVRPVFD